MDLGSNVNKLSNVLKEIKEPMEDLLSHVRASINAKKWDERIIHKIESNLTRIENVQKRISFLVENQEKQGFALKENEEKNETSKYRLLIVDDDVLSLDLLESLFKDDYMVSLATNGQMALEILKKENFDLIISDLNMPRMTGLELLTLVRSNTVISHIPFLMISSNDDVDKKVEILEKGADSFICKPFDSKHIKAKVASLIRSRKELFKLYSTNPMFTYRNSSINSKDSKWLDVLNVKIREKITDKSLDVETVSKSMNMSRSNLQRKLKSLTNFAPNDYIKIIRLRTAAHIFKDGEYRVNEVCDKVGFSNHSYFDKCFLKQFGQTPREYKKMCRDWLEK